ncbi:2-dehydro-3-deoxygalactonokinase, partial [Salmonella enterica]|uniref:2-dehydro-3-deoxygalactonokinase n=1 Tax=Salmonella enterica TaxID=28901 RepID=UPI001CB76083
CYFSAGFPSFFVLPPVVFSPFDTPLWVYCATPVVMAGMIGSIVGWQNAPYLPVPALFSAFGELFTAVGDNIWIIPG